jgi:hypothetical protein
MKKAAAQDRNSKRIGLRSQVLVAALDCSNGDLNQTFTSEDLLVAAWKRDPIAWGLRGYEHYYPDADKIHKELDSRGTASAGIVASGLLSKVRERIYRLTPAGFATAAQISGIDSETRGKAERVLADALAAILWHSVVREWIKNPHYPKHFRDAGHFWGVAPGTPREVIRERILEIDRTLDKALKLLESGGTYTIGAKRDGVSLTRADIEQVLDFQATLKKRFGQDLATLQVNLGQQSCSPLRFNRIADR